MPSPAATKYGVASLRSEMLRALPTNMRLRPMTREQTQVYLHAALAASVASWNAYLSDLVRDFFAESANPLLSQFHSMHTLAKEAAENALGRFNTPNWENSRNLLVQCTGYDPIADWIWPVRSMTTIQVRERLNEILKVRHSFAHGYAIPAYSWTQSPTGRVRLTSTTVKDADAFLKNLVSRTDLGMKNHLLAVYGAARLW